MNETMKLVDIKDLVLGMYIAKLDSPRKGSPLIGRGFYLQTETQLQQLSDVCQRVIVDLSKGNIFKIYRASIEYNIDCLEPRIAKQDYYSYQTL